MGHDIKFEQDSPFSYRIRRDLQAGMRTDGVLYLSPELFERIKPEGSPRQVMNVATLPGIVGESLAMPDVHWGYGFPIGGVAAFDVDEGVISPGGVGYDINCGINLTRTRLRLDEVRKSVDKIIHRIYETVPAGVGQGGGVKVSRQEFDRVLTEGGRWAMKKGLASREDVRHMEEEGCLPGADPDPVTDRARERGYDQIGTLGSGNHFIEIQVVEKIFDSQAAQAFGLFENQICIMVHSGSRGFGYQICTDTLPLMGKAVQKYGISIPDRQLACAPIQSPEGQAYVKAMNCAANYAWANRLGLRFGAMRALAGALKIPEEQCGFGMVYDVCHNIAKFERHLVQGKERRVCVHRKGATRALPPEHPGVPEAYRRVGSPVLIPGDMGRASYVLVGEPTALARSFGSAPHGAGRLMSRQQGKKLARSEEVRARLARQGIIVEARSKVTLAEEQPEVYKDVEEVARVAKGAGLARPVAKLRPLGALKG